MTDADESFLVQAGDGGELSLDCLYSSCYYRITSGSATLAELRVLGAAHLAEKHRATSDHKADPA